MKINITRTLTKILVLLVLLAGTLAIVYTNVNIMKSAVELAILREEARYYNSQPVKTDEMTQEFLEVHAERQQIYQSDDFVVRTFANQSCMVKLLILAWTIISTVVLLPFMWLNIVDHEVARINRKAKKYKKCRKAQVPTSRSIRRTI